MNEPCTVESGLFKKTPCGQASVAKCATCERPLCSTHAVAQLSAAQKKTGVFMCKECDTAKKDYDKAEAKQAEKKKQAEMMKSLANPAPPRKPGSPPPAAAVAPTTPAAKPAPAGAKAAPPPPPKPADDAPLEFTPSSTPKK
jgi:hypothetical protein